MGHDEGTWTRAEPGGGVIVPRSDTPDFCLERGPVMGLCTRPKYHQGRHMATVGNDRVIAAWPGSHAPSTDDLTDGPQ